MVFKITAYCLIAGALLVTSAPAQSIAPTVTPVAAPTNAPDQRSSPGARAAANLRAGAVITSGDLIINGETAEAIYEYKASLVGMELKRAIYAGGTVTRTDIRQPTLVRRNAIVTVRYTKGPLLISTEGRALNAGAKGDLIRLINLESKTTLTAIVAGPNLARAQ